MLRINGIGGEYSVPRTLNVRKFAFGKFGDTLRSGGEEVDANAAKEKLEDAWKFVTTRAALHKPCNDYFKSLPQGKTLQQICQGTITLHALWPQEGYTFANLPAAETAGNDIGLNPVLLFLDKDALRGTLIHELAHIGGATTNPRDPYDKAIAAERALTHCLLSSQFDRDNVGIRIQMRLRNAETRLA